MRLEQSATLLNGENGAGDAGVAATGTAAGFAEPFPHFEYEATRQAARGFDDQMLVAMTQGTLDVLEVANDVVFAQAHQL